MQEQVGITIPEDYLASNFYILFDERKHQFLCELIWNKTSLKEMVQVLVEERC